MIRTKKIRKPSQLDSEPHSSAISRSRTLIRNAPDKKIKKFTEKWRTVKAIKRELFQNNGGKCAYCETHERNERTMDVEHYRPKSAVAECPGHDGYWWLAEETDNFLISCKVCNSDNKGSKFPLIDERKRVFDESGNLDNEHPFLINPNEEDPSGFIGFKERPGPIDQVFALGLDNGGRGQRSIADYGLNDQDLKDSRGEFLVPLQALSNELISAIDSNNDDRKRRAIEKVRKYTHSGKAYAGFRRDFFISRDLGEYISDE
ncbi:MAG: hypothetical protein PsegKO_33240 [Pseudohongiellaceae bacterium]